MLLYYEMMSQNNQVKILLVDDEEDILEFLRYNLELEGYEIDTAKDGNLAVERVKAFKPDLIILDIMMPGMNGIEVCEKLRDDGLLDNSIVAFLSARSESFTHVSALDAGGDDFLTKPIKPNVLKSKVKALLRRIPKSHSPQEIATFGELIIDFEKYLIWIEGKELLLPRKEFELLKLLVSKPGKVFERAYIMKTVWGSEVIVGERTIDVHIRKLREKIGSQYISTLKGVGYKFEF